MKTDLICLDYARLWHYVFDVRRLLWVVPFVLPLLLAGCGEDEEVLVTEKRDFIEDDNLKIFLSEYPDGWRQVPVPRSRFGPIMAFRCGETCETTLSVRLKGSFLANVNRWREQFGKTEREEVIEVGTVSFQGVEGILVEEDGTFRGKKQNWAMIAALVDHEIHGLCVLKMTGSASEVFKQKMNLAKVFKGIKLRGQN